MAPIHHLMRQPNLYLVYKSILHMLSPIIKPIKNRIKKHLHLKDPLLLTQLRDPLAPVRLWYQDFQSNRRYATAKKKILVVRHPHKNPGFYNIILDWLAEELPGIRALFELRQITCRVPDWSSYILHIPWLQDPVQQWSPKAYLQAKRLAAKCDEKEIPIINRVENLLNVTKSNGSLRIASAGIRTPRTIVIENIDDFKETLLGLSLPLIVREDWGHGGSMYRADRMDQIRKMDLASFSRPIAVEFLDTQNKVDGLYRKYRYIAAGDEGVTASLHVQKSWIVRGSNCEFSKALRDEELAFINNSDPNHKILQRARRALDLDFVAFDYSYDHTGQLVVWEGNPYPTIHFSKGSRTYRKPAVQRTLAAIVKMYLKKSGIPIHLHPRIDEILNLHK
jgi:hypothetical protein